MGPSRVQVPTGAPPDLGDKLDRLAGLGRSRGLRALVLRDPVSLTWLLNARVHVPQTLDTACLDVVVDLTAAPRITVHTNAIEAPRLQDGELHWLDADWRVVDWWADRTVGQPTGDDVGSDRGHAGTVGVGAELAVLRRTLTPHQQQLLREVGADAAAAATAACLRLAPSTSEYAAAGVLAQELLDRGLDPVVLLVAGERRVAAHRHPLPSTAEIGARAMLVCCARRSGMVASVTRHVALRPPTAEQLDAHDRLLLVEAAFLDATRPGVTLGSVVRAGTAAYAQHGFAADEWHRHHQGGLTGLSPREFPAAPTCEVPVPLDGAVAWNPSGAGWKVEDTCLVGPAGPEPLVHDPAWPALEVAGRLRPGVLVP